MRTALVAAALLLVPAIAAGVAPQPAATNGSSPLDTPVNSVAHLTLGETATNGSGNATDPVNRTANTTARITNQSLNVASAVSIGRADAAARIERYAVAERLNRTDDSGAVLAESLNDLAGRVATLRADERALHARYANGSIGAARFADGVARLDARARRLDARLARIEGAVGQNDTLRDRVERLDRLLIGYDGPVRSRVLAAVRGTEGRFALYAAGSGDGAVLSMINDSRYVREAARPDRRRASPAAFSIVGAGQRIAELYPLASTLKIEGGISEGTAVRGLGDGTYEFRSDLPFGSLRSYLDGTTRDVFHEVQYRRFDRMDQPASTASTANGTRLVVDRTHVGGPLRIATYNATDGEPVARTVRIGHRRAETGPDGVAWTLMPSEPRVTVETVGPAGGVNVTVEPIPVTPLNGTS